MRNNVVQHKLSTLLFLLLGGMISLVAGQYYYFDSATSTAPYQQGCSEYLYVKATTESNATGAAAGLLRLQLDPVYFSYYTGSSAAGLQANLFIADTSTFGSYSNPLVFPYRVDAGKTILHIDRYNSGSPFVGNARYGTLLFAPKYNPSDYTGTFSIIYNGDTIRTSLSYGGQNIINSGHQHTYLTGYYYVYQKPCANDTTAPAANINVPTGGTKKSYLSGIVLDLLENAGDANVPYVRTGGLPGIGTRTGNIRGINNQYGVNLDTFNIRISGNGNARYFTGGMFSSSGTLAAAANAKTRQFRDKNYGIDIDSSELFDYGIEKTMTITGNVRDRNNNLRTFSLSFNQPVGPRLIPGSRNPAAGANGIGTTPPVMLGIQDDRAGVNSGTIRITLQGIGGTTYGPYIFSGSELNVLGVAGAANEPDYYITISGHVAFPSAGTIQVSVYAEDMEGNVDTISDYSFNTRPSCADLGCCDDVYLQTGNNPPFLYTWGSTLFISGGNNPSFTINGNTGIVDCGLRNDGFDIYKGVETNTGAATYLSFFNLSHLILSGTNVRAVLSGKTLYLQRIYVPPITGGCIGACGGGGGGGEPFIKDDCQLPSDLACANDEGIDDSPSYYDHTCCAAHGAATGCDISDSPYSQEINDSFQRAYNLNITNKCPISDARLDDGLLRKDLAKMMTMFTIQIVGIYPDTHKAGCDKFSDTDNLTDEMKFFTKTSCQLYLMGLHPNGKTPKPVFDPNDPVPRTEFGTVLSRLIYGDTYNVHTGEELIYKRYEKHLKALNRDGIMKKIVNPFMLEKRARAILMLYRTDIQKLVEKYRLVAPAHNGALSLLENVW